MPGNAGPCHEHQNFTSSRPRRQPWSAKFSHASPAASHIEFFRWRSFVPFWHSRCGVGLRRLRSVGLLLVGIADNSVIPMPGSTDVLTLWLAATGRKYWPYYAAMASLGALLGGYITYDLARRGGKEAGERRKARKARKFYRSFERWGLGAVAVPATLPPPFPIVPFWLAAGALQDRKKFLAALALGRGNPVHRHRCVGGLTTGTSKASLRNITNRS